MLIDHEFDHTALLTKFLPLPTLAPNSVPATVNSWDNGAIPSPYILLGGEVLLDGVPTTVPVKLTPPTQVPPPYHGCWSGSSPISPAGDSGICVEF